MSCYYQEGKMYHTWTFSGLDFVLYEKKRCDCGQESYHISNCKQKLPEESCSTCKYSSRYGGSVCYDIIGVCNKEHDKWQPREPEKKDKLAELIDKVLMVELPEVLLEDGQVARDIAKAIYELFEKEVVPKEEQKCPHLNIYTFYDFSLSSWGEGYNKCVKDTQENLRKMKGK